MGTRGTITIIYRKKQLVLYNHYDSYPSGLGQQLIEELQLLLVQHGLAGLIVLFEKLVIIKPYEDECRQPTVEEMKQLHEYKESDSSESIAEKDALNDWSWFSLLGKTQGSLVRTLESGYALNLLDCDNKTWNQISRSYAGSLEYNYVVDLDHEQFYLREKKKNSLCSIHSIPDSWGTRVE